MLVEEVEQVHNLVRRVKTVRGEIGFRMVCAPRFDYGRASHRVEPRDGEGLFLSESPTDPRWLASLRTTEQVLVTDSLVYRYKTGDAFQDGLVGEEGTFSMCSFWYVECLARAGDLEQARFVFEKAHRLCEPSGASTPSN